jgi:hypothetical protein
VTTFANPGGAINREGALKFLQQLLRSGYITGLAVSQKGGGADMSVDIAAGGGLLVTSSGEAFHGWNTATVNKAVTAAHGSLNRLDAVVAYINLPDITTATTNNEDALKFAVVAGTPASSPSAPNDAAIQSAVGASNPWIPLAELNITAALSSVTNSQITDRRIPAITTLPYLYGGASNTKGHLVPNVADDTLMLLNATQSSSGKTFTASALNTSTLDGTAWLTDASAGWIAASGAWTYLSATTISVPAADAARMSRGTRLRLVQTSTKYFVVVGVSGTTVTLTAGTSYTLANAAITSPFFSNASCPPGFPSAFEYTATLTGWSGTPTQYCRFMVDGAWATLWFNISGTSNAGTAQLSLPVTAYNDNGFSFEGWMGYAMDSGSIVGNSGRMAIDPATDPNKMQCFGGVAGGWTGSGTKAVRGTARYRIA